MDLRKAYNDIIEQKLQRAIKTPDIQFEKILFMLGNKVIKEVVLDRFFTSRLYEKLLIAIEYEIVQQYLKNEKERDDYIFRIVDKFGNSLDYY